MIRSLGHSFFYALGGTAFILLAILGISSCGDDKLVSRYGGIPAAFGKANKIAVIADSTWWHDGLEEKVDFTFGGPYLILPAPEPLYDLTYFSVKELDAQPARKELRTYFLISHEGLRGTPVDDMIRKDLGDSLQLMHRPFIVKAARNKWASGQLLVYFYGKDADAVYEAIQLHGPAMLEKLKAHDMPILDNQTYAARENAILQKKVAAHTGMRFRIPGEYVHALTQDSVIWLRKDLKEMTLGLLFKTYDYTDPEQFSKEGFRILQDDMAAIVSSTSLDLPTRMIIDDQYLPMFLSPVTIDGQYAMEVRGLWRMYNDIKGGPFISYLILSPDKKKLILASGFVYGPGKDKREWMQQLEIILRSGKF